MGRFGQLEFDGEEESPVVGRTGAAADELRCVDEGTRAFGRAEFEPGLRWYGRALEHDPASPEGWLGQVRCLIELGRFAEASQWADLGLERNPDAPDLLAAKAVALARQGRAGEAMPFSDAAVERPDTSAYAWMARGDVLVGAGLGPQSERCFDQARQLAPGDWMLRWIGARARQYWRQFAAALQLVREAAALEPGRPVVWVTAGQCELALGLVDAARRSFGQALALDGGCRAAEAGLRQAGGLGWWARLSRRWFARGRG